MKFFSKLITKTIPKLVTKKIAEKLSGNVSKNIKDTVYARNEFYITKEGFSDLATLMQKRGFYIRLKYSAMSYNRFLQNGFETIYD